MAIQTNQMLSNPRLPSEASALLKSLRGRRIKRMVRVLACDPQYLVDTLAIREQQLFALGYGPLLIQFDDGRVLGLGEDGKRLSVLVWQDIDSVIDANHIKLGSAYEGSMSIDCEDSRFSEPHWAGYLEQDVVQVRILQFTRGDSAYMAERYPNQRGILLTVATGAELLISREIRTDGPAHLTITNEATLSDELRGKLIDHLP